jgi:lipid A ethanolaminephosphotransferase
VRFTSFDQAGQSQELMNLLQPITRFKLLLATTLWVSVFCNLTPLKHFFSAPSAGTGLTAAAFTLGGWLFVFTVTALLLFSLSLLFWGRSVKLLCMAMIILAAVLSYFSFFLGTQFDKTMLLNVLQTHTSEALELMNWRLLLWVLFVGVLPAIAVWRIPLKPSTSHVKHLSYSLGLLAMVGVLTATVIYAQYPRYASAVRNHAVTFHVIAPSNIAGAALSLAYAGAADSTTRAARGTDAHQSYAIAKPRLFIMVLGETARAKNHGLNGYERDTTPRMRAAGGYYFPDTASCGTATAISLPCMFSGFKREEFSLSLGRANETLVDVVLHAGARVIWRDNDAGCKGVCDRAEVEDFTNASNKRWCTEPGECFDEILLEGLEDKIRAQNKDTFVVLHLKGSHGPAYYKRYPDAFERFTPTCKNTDLSACDMQDLRNAYDNSILYTDHVVGEVITLLEKMSAQYAAAMLYVSDHGESIGESGLYLHGMPYAMAPKEQIQVPMYSWVSPQFIEMERWDTACMAKQTKIARSHDNVYSTVLGFMEIDTHEYKAALDLFEPCDEDRDGQIAGLGRK